LFEDIKKIKLPTKYEILSDYSLILNLAELIEKAIPSLKFTNKKTRISYSLKDLNMNIVKPTFGTLPYGDLNARTYSFDNGEYLIVFESELLQFCNLITKIIAKSFPYNKKDGKITYQFDEQAVLEKLEDDETILTRFKDLVISFLTTGYARAAKQYYLEGTYLDLHAHLLEAIETFIMGHEYSHILLKHVTSQTKKNLNNADKFQMIYSWPQEYQADGLGLPLMLIGLRHTGKQNDFISYCGAELFFSAYEIIQRGACILKNGHDNFYWRGGSSDGLLGTHPPAGNRREYLRKLMKNNYGERSIETSLLVEKIIKTLWEKTKPILITVTLVAELFVNVRVSTSNVILSNAPIVVVAGPLFVLNCTSTDPEIIETVILPHFIVPESPESTVISPVLSHAIIVAGVEPSVSSALKNNPGSIPSSRVSVTQMSFAALKIPDSHVGWASQRLVTGLKFARPSSCPIQNG